MRESKLLKALLLALLPSAVLAAADKEAPAPPPAITAKVAGLERRAGFLDLYWDGIGGRLYATVRPGEELLHQTTLSYGLGSNPVGLDRGQLGPTRLVSFERRGPAVLLVQKNLRFRALGGSPDEARAVESSFARSVIWGGKVAAEEDGRVLVDLTTLLLGDAHGIVDRLREAGQGDYAPDEARSAVDPAFCRAFPRNSEAEADLTFAAHGRAGALVGTVTPDPGAVTVRVRHSFVALPEPGYTPRAFDPRVGANFDEVYDYASPFTGPLVKRWINRHRLQKKDPAAAVSEVVKPIVYYLDPAAPEPIRSALLDGASWWAAAFEAAGFKNAYEVRLLPEGADPMDVRYNIVQWVHRSTRGWSYGSSVTDPRTGEIVKGNVTLGSLRVRQDHLIASGMRSPWDDGPDAAAWAGQGDAAQLALDRLRQLAAHEVGHTLGFAHNFAASSQDRASVMDYPAPLVRIRDGKLDFDQAYTKGVGAFDRFAVAYAYTQFAPGTDETAALRALVRDGLARGLRYVNDVDAREVGTAHAFASVWDNGPDAVASLRHEMEVRRLGLARFGASSQPDGEPRSLLEARLLPLYLHHRYQLEAAAKLVGGLDFSYAVRDGADSAPTAVRTIVPGTRQREALAAVLDCVDPAFLTIPPRVLALIPPRADGFAGGIAEFFPSRTGVGFDPLAAAGNAADVALAALLNPLRAARLVQYRAESPDVPSLADVLRAVVARTFGPEPPDDQQAGMPSAIRREVQRVTVQRLRALAETAPSLEVRAEAESALRRLAGELRAPVGDPRHRMLLRQEIERFLARPYPNAKPTEPDAVPQGPPIG
jgi:uncharacterized protein DUF4953/uncharacterized protein DUF5117